MYAIMVAQWQYVSQPGWLSQKSQIQDVRCTNLREIAYCFSVFLNSISFHELQIGSFHNCKLQEDALLQTKCKNLLMGEIWGCKTYKSIEFSLKNNNVNYTSELWESLATSTNNIINI